MSGDDQITITVRASKAYLELHERGPIGKLDAHKTFRRVGIIKCPVCGEKT